MTKKRYLITAKCYDRKGNLLSEAQNSYTKSHPIQAHFASLVGEPQRIYLHAEIAALLKCGDKTPYKLFIQSDSQSLPIPCAICQYALTEWGVKTVIVQGLKNTFTLSADIYKGIRTVKES